MTVSMFGPPEPKNRRLTPKEIEEDIQECKIWGRYPKSYILDQPFYKGIIPEPIVNFRLNFKE